MRNASNLFWIELILRWPKISFSDDWVYIYLGLDSASRASNLENEDGDSHKLLQLLKVIKIDLFSRTTLGRLVLISKSIVWSPESEDPLKKNCFYEKNCLPYLQNSDLILIYLYLINVYHHSIKTW